MSLFALKPTHAPVKAYYAALAKFHTGGHTTEGNTRSAFADLLRRCCAPYDWHLVEEFAFKGKANQSLRADGALIDDLTVQHGIWEAKDSDDDLQKEIKAKVAKGYRLDNILFQSPTRAVLYQDNRIALDCDLTRPENLVEVLQLFFSYRDPNIPDWQEAVTKFAEKIPDLAGGVTKILEDEDKKNPLFRERFQSFATLCRQSINPDLTDDSIRKMLVQHLLTARIFIRVFQNEEFLRRNVIAVEIEKVIDSITSRYFSRNEFLKPLDRFYTAIEKAAESQTGYTEKQHFLNAVYEKFFQRFDTKQADTHGIVYTPQPIVDFMVRSVDEILQQEFGKSLSDKGVHILDPFTGTGNFITRIMQQIKRSALPQKYAEELHCNEIMLLPYYIASMNIEHAYLERAGQYKPFEGICLVDTFDLADSQQAALFTTENTARVKKQRASPITVIVGNPPYNVGQKDENDENANRSHPGLDARVKETFRALSKASSTTKLGNMYVRAFRWAADRLEGDGIIAFVTNNGFISKRVFDGMRLCLEREFSRILVLDLGGDVRDNPKLSGTTHNVFGIQPGVCITFLIKSGKHLNHSLEYARVDEYWRKAQKFGFLVDSGTICNIGKGKITPQDGTWLDKGPVSGYESYYPMASGTEGIFKTHSMGANTNRDRWTISFQEADLRANVQGLLETYNSDRLRYLETRDKKSFKWTNDKNKIKWSSSLRNYLRRNIDGKYVEHDLRLTSHRPFVTQFIYFNELLTHRRAKLPRLFPLLACDPQNQTICIPGPGNRKSFGAFAVKRIPSLDFAFEKAQCFPFFTYDKTGDMHRENITAEALAEFRTHYSDQKIIKWNIFHATYAVLHHPEYRTRYAANLKRELPRIPFPPDFHAFAAAGKRLMELHIDYEKLPEYPLEQIEHPTNEVSFRVERMKLSKDKSELRYNDFLTLRGIPAAAFEYRLGNRSALDWVIDQYRVSTDPRSGITNDPNRSDDPHYILRLIGQVITVSLETQQVIASFPSLNLGA